VSRGLLIVVLFATTASAQSLVFRGAPTELRLIGRSEAVRIERLDVNGMPAGGAAMMVTVTAPPGGEVSPDPQPIGSWATSVQVSIGAGVSLSAPVYFRSGTRGARSWTASGAAFTDAAASVFIRDDALTCTMESGTTLDTEVPAGCFNVLVRPFVASTIGASMAAAHRGAWGLRVIDAHSGNTNASDISVFDHGGRAFGDIHARTWMRVVSWNNQPNPIIAQLTNGTGIVPSLVDVKVKQNLQLTVAGFTVDAGYDEAFSDAGVVVGTWHLLEFSATGAGNRDGGRHLFLDGRLIARQEGLDFSGTSMPIAQFTLGEPYADSQRWQGTIDFDDIRTAATPLASTLGVSSDGGAVGACVPVEVQLRSSWGGLAWTREATVVEVDAGATASVFSDVSCATPGNQVTLGVGLTSVGFSVRSLGTNVAVEVSSADFLPARGAWSLLVIDAGVDAGTDAGVDAGIEDAGVEPDAGMEPDAGVEPDAGMEPGPPLELGVGCGCGHAGLWGAALALVLLIRLGRGKRLRD
jgi:hypothetical protein